MDKKYTNKASLVDAGVYKPKKASENTKVMQNNSSSYNFVNLSIKKASNKIDKNNLKIFNSYGQSCKFITIFTVILVVIHNNVNIQFLCLSHIKYSFYY